MQLGLVQRRGGAPTWRKAAVTSLAGLALAVVAGPAAAVSFGPDAPASYARGSGQAISYEVNAEANTFDDVLVIAWSDDEQRMVSEFAHSRTSEPWQIEAGQLEELPLGRVNLQLLRRGDDGVQARADHWVQVEDAPETSEPATVSFAADAPQTYANGSGASLAFEVEGDGPEGRRLSASAYWVEGDRFIDEFTHGLELASGAISSDRLDLLPGGQVVVYLLLHGGDRETEWVQHVLEVDAEQPSHVVFADPPQMYQLGSGEAINLEVRGGNGTEHVLRLAAWSHADQQWVDAFAHTLEGREVAVSIEALEALPPGQVTMLARLTVDGEDRGSDHATMEVLPRPTAPAPQPDVSFTAPPSTYQQGSGVSIPFQVQEVDADADANVLAIAWSDGEARMVSGFAHTLDAADGAISAARLDMLPAGANNVQLVLRIDGENVDRTDAWIQFTPADDDDDNGDDDNGDGDNGDGDNGDGDNGDGDNGDGDNGDGDNGDGDNGDGGDGGNGDDGDDDDTETGGWTEIPDGAQIIYVDDGDDMTGLRRSGTADRPVVYTGRPGQPRPRVGRITNHVNTPMQHVWFIGLEVDGRGHSVGIRLRGDIRNILIEDCLVSGAKDNVVLQRWGDGAQIRDIAVRRSVIVDSNDSSGHSQGLYGAVIRNLLIEDCVFDHNGHGNGNDATIFNHNIYLAACRNVTVRNNVLSRGSSFGLKMSSNRTGDFDGAVVEGNLFLGNGNGITIDNSARFAEFHAQNLKLRGNVFTQIGRRLSNANQSFGIRALSIRWVEIHDNLFVDKPFRASHPPIRLDPNRPHRDIDIRRNVGHEWNGRTGDYIVTPSHSSITITNNLMQLPSNRYYDASRTVASYNAEIGGSESWTQFIAEARRQRRGFWREQYTPKPVIEYLAEGFTLLPTFD